MSDIITPMDVSEDEGVKEHLPKKTNLMERTVATVKTNALKIEKQKVNNAYYGFLLWNCFYLGENLCADCLQHSDKYPIYSKILTIFVENSLIARSFTEQNGFKYAATFFLNKENNVEILGGKETLHKCPFSDKQSYVFQTCLQKDDNSSETSTIWVETPQNGEFPCIEIFHPHDFTDRINKFINEYVLNFLSTKWMNLSLEKINNRVYSYNLPSNIRKCNAWNYYYLLLRSLQYNINTKGKKMKNKPKTTETLLTIAREVNEVFHSNPEDLWKKKNALIETFGHLVADCATFQDNDVNNINVKRFFSEDSEPIFFDEDSVSSLIHIIVSCKNPSNELWNNFRDLRPKKGDYTSSSSWASNTPAEWSRFVEVDGAVRQVYFVKED